MGGDGVVEDSASESKTELEAVNINVRCSNGSKYSVRVSLDSTVGSFKDLIARNCDIPAQQQRLIYKGRILKDDQTLQSYGNSIFRSRLR
jgi:ubiquilin